MKNSRFYFLRHAETDHNVQRIYDDEGLFPINERGVEQALEVQKRLLHLPIRTVFTSPLHRVQQTKEFVLQNRTFESHICDEFRECKGELWRLFLASEERELTPSEWVMIHEFTSRVEIGLSTLLSYEGPTLLIAHGGTYWALAHILQLPGNRKIDNCNPVEIIHQNGKWQAVFL